MDQPDITNIYTYGCRVYPIRNEVLADQDRTANKPMHEHRLRVYRKDPGGAEPLSDTHQPQDLDTDSEIGSIIIVSNKNSHEDNRINEINSKTDSDCEDKPRNYPTPQSLVEQANM